MKKEPDNNQTYPAITVINKLRRTHNNTVTFMMEQINDYSSEKNGRLVSSK